MSDNVVRVFGSKKKAAASFIFAIVTVMAILGYVVPTVKTSQANAQNTRNQEEKEQVFNKMLDAQQSNVEFENCLSFNSNFESKIEEINEKVSQMKDSEVKNSEALHEIRTVLDSPLPEKPEKCGVNDSDEELKNKETAWNKYSGEMQSRYMKLSALMQKINNKFW